MFGLLIAKAAGARTIITSSSDDKLNLATKMGATHTINYKRTPEWDAEVRRLTKGVGAHHIIDNVGINEIEKCFNSVAPGGVISNIGFLGVQSKAAPNVPMLALTKQATLRCVPCRLSLHSRVVSSRYSGIAVGSKQQFEELLQFADFNQIHPHIDRTFKFEQAVEALQYLESAQHFGKVVIHVTSH